MTQDLLVEGVHFRRATTGARDLGHKALAVNLSDLAAMAAEPVAALVGLCLPSGEVGDDEVDDLYSGLETLAARNGVTVAGGDVTAGPALILAVTAVGRVAAGVPSVLRAGGRPGDVLCVTGALGASAAGSAPGAPGARRGRAERGRGALRAAHLRPEPWLAAGRSLARAARAMCWTSTASRSTRCAWPGRAASGRFSRPRPCSPRAWPRSARRQGRRPAPAVTGGEDYELLAAIPASRVEAAHRAALCPLTPVGHLEEGLRSCAAELAGGSTVLTRPRRSRRAASAVVRRRRGSRASA